MIVRAFRRMKAWLIGGLIVVATALPVAALNVQPVIIDLLSSGRRTSTVITLQNTLPSTVPVELIAHSLELVDGELRETEIESEDLLIFPSQATLEPGRSQAFRVQWVGEPELAQSQHFYVTVAQLPVQLPENQNAIQVLYNFKVLVSVGSPNARPDLNVASATVVTDEATGRNTPLITVQNTGGTYGYVGRSRMTITQRDAAGAEVFRQSFEPDDIQRLMGLGLVPSGQTRRLPINLELPQAGGSVSVELSAVEGR